MKKIFLLWIVLAMFTTQQGWSQAKKYVLLEHFTNTDCGPCAAQNPGFEANIINPNPKALMHIAYHSSFPGPSDPFYLYDQANNLARQGYYAVQGVPNVRMNGNKKDATPGTFTQSDIDEEAALTSPIVVEASISGTTTKDVQVIVTSVGEIPAGSYSVRVAVVERKIIRTTAPGSNGEKEFFNISRKMLPNAAGTPIALNATGQQFILNFDFPLDNQLNADQLEVVAFVQNDDDQSVLNCGSSFFPNGLLIAGAKEAYAGTPSTATAVPYKLKNEGFLGENFKITLIPTQPTDWAAKMKIGDSTYATPTANIYLAAGDSVNLELNVTPGTSSAVGTYKVEMSSLQKPNAPTLGRSAFVIANVTDLILNNSSATGAGPTPFPSGWQSIFDEAFVAAGSTKHAGSNEIFFTRAMLDGALGQVKHIYFNVGWTFPAITTDLAAKFSSFCDGGGNFFVSGQDVSWAAFETMAGTSVNGYFSPEAQAFIQNYLGADYINDGATADNKWIAEATDPYFGTFGTSTISNFYTGSNFFPDNLTTFGTGKAIARYVAGNANKVAGTRNTNGTWKTVYFAPGVEMLNVLKRKDFLKATYQWFHGIVSNNEIDARFHQIGQCYPNPATNFTMVPVINVKNNLTLSLSDASGKQIWNQSIPANSDEYRLDTQKLTNGIYYYQLLDGSTLIDAQSINIVK